MNATTTATAPISADRRLSGRVTVETLIDSLLDLPMDAEFIITMVEGKGFPVITETTHSLFILGGVGEVLRTSRTLRAEGPALLPNQLNGSKALLLRSSGTVRSLIKGLIGNDPEAVIDLEGHFYSDFSFRLYPAPKHIVQINPRDLVSVPNADWSSSELLGH
jgi:hypothetical protein